MTMMIKSLALGAGFAAIAAASPASAQYYPSYGAPYGNAYGYHNNAATNMAAQRCAAAVPQAIALGQFAHQVIEHRVSPAGVAGC